MPELTFRVVDAQPVPLAALPQLALRLEIQNRAGDRVDGILLRCAVRIRADARSYDAGERHNLRDVFGAADVWERSSKSLLWAQVGLVVPRFEAETNVELNLACGQDLVGAAASYLGGLDSGEVPIVLQFSGSVFYATPGGLQVAQIPWDREAAFRLPLRLLHAAIEAHFPNRAWLPLRRDVFARVDAYRIEQGLSDVDQALERLLAGAAHGGAR